MTRCLATSLSEGSNPTDLNMTSLFKLLEFYDLFMQHEDYTPCGESVSL